MINNTSRGMLSILALVVLTPTLHAQLSHESLKFIADDGSPGDRFGSSIAIDHNTIVVGASLADDLGPNSGSAYIFDATTGHQIIELLSRDLRPGDNFGYSVAIGNNFIAVGARYDDIPTASSSGIKTGSVYLFDATTGLQITKVLADDFTSFAEFGVSVAIDSGTLAVGASSDGFSGNLHGSAYTFDLKSNTQSAKLVASDFSSEDFFGYSVDISGDIVIVGSPRNDDHGNNSGSAYLFNATTGEQLAKLTADDAEGGDRFGWAVAIEDDIAVVGSYLDSDNGNHSGSIYLFDTKTGQQITKILPDQGSTDDWFGWTVDINNGIIAAGAIGTSDSIRLYDATSFAQINKLTASDRDGSTDQFSWSIGLSNNTLVTGATQDDENGDSSGSAYLFDLSCRADLNSDGLLNFFDISYFIDIYLHDDLNADFNDDELLNFFDISAFLNTYTTGCP